MSYGFLIVEVFLDRLDQKAITEATTAPRKLCGRMSFIHQDPLLVFSTRLLALLELFWYSSSFVNGLDTSCE